MAQLGTAVSELGCFLLAVDKPTGAVTVKICHDKACKVCIPVPGTPSGQCGKSFFGGGSAKSVCQ